MHHLSTEKNVVNILIKNALDCFCGAVIYWAVGYAFAYGVLDNDPNGVNKVSLLICQAIIKHFSSDFSVNQKCFKIEKFFNFTLVSH